MANLIPAGMRRGKPKQTRPLVSSARQIKLGDRTEVERIRRLRQAWTNEAWAYRDAIGEIRYPLEFMSNAITRMRIYPALMVAPDEPPIKLDEAPNVPSKLVSTALADLQALGQGNQGLRPILANQYTNNKIAGEMYLVIWLDDDGEHSEIRSIDEVIIDAAGDVWLKDDPMAQVGTPELRLLDRESTYIARIWTPHKRWRGLADSPMRALLDRCEELLLVSRVVRSAARSRLAGNGLLLIAQELSLQGINPTNNDPESDPFMDELAKAMTTAIADEGDASAVVPIVARVPGEMLKEGKAAQYIQFGRDFDGKAAELRQELINRIANGLDLPQEVVTGKADLNHWTAWEVDDNTFRNHVEPDVIAQVDGLTAAYAQPYLQAREEWDADLISRVCYWYDPVELVTHPDRAADAQQSFDRGAIGRETLRTVTGFGDGDKPDPVDRALYVLSKSRGAPPEVVTALIMFEAPELRPLIETAISELDPTTADAPAAGDQQQPAESQDSQPTDQGAPADGQPEPPTGGGGPTTAAGAPADADGDDDGDSIDEIQRRGVMVAFYPTPEQAQALAMDGGEPVNDLHCTLAYLGHAEDLTDEQVTAIHDICGQAAAGCAPLDGEFGGIGRFTAEGSPDGDPVYASVDVPGLAALRTQICEALTDAGVPVAGEHGFTPHTTLAYIDPTAPMPAHRLEPVPATFSALSVVVGPDRADYEMTGAQKPVVAAIAERTVHTHASQQLLDIDRQLRARLTTAADAALRRQLERAGARLRSKVANDTALRASLTDVAQLDVAATLGQSTVAALGLAADDLLGGEYADLAAQWDAWVKSAQNRARQIAARIVGIPADAQVLDDFEVVQAEARSAGWSNLLAGLGALAQQLLFNPHPDAPPAGEYDPNVVVPASLIRESLAIAGSDVTNADGAAVLELPAGTWGVGQGSAVQSFLDSNGAEREHYTWVHGDTDRPLEAHMELDGYQFESWDDPGLENHDTFPEVEVLAPGDHAGCTCDAWITWATGGTEMPIAASSR